MVAGLGWLSLAGQAQELGVGRLNNGEEYGAQELFSYDW